MSGAPPPRFNYKRADWQLFTQSADELFRSDDPSHADADSFCSNVTRLLYKAASDSIPLLQQLSANPKRMSRIWCEEIKNAVRLRNSAQYRWQRSRSLEDLIAHKREKAATQRLIRTKAKESWATFCSNEKEGLKAGYLWKVVRCMANRSSNAGAVNVKVQGSALADDKDKADLFAEHFARMSSDANYREPFVGVKALMEQIAQKKVTAACANTDSPLNDPFTAAELEVAIAKSRAASAPGSDLISYYLLKNLSTHCRTVLLKLYNLMWSTNVYPRSWKTIIVVPMLKGGKPEIDPNSYRPISLAS